MKLGSLIGSLIFVISSLSFDFFFYFVATDGILFGLPFSVKEYLLLETPYFSDFQMNFCLNVALMAIWGAIHSLSAQPFFQEKFCAMAPSIFVSPIHVFFIFSGILLLPVFVFWISPISSPRLNHENFSAHLEKDVVYDLLQPLLPSKWGSELFVSLLESSPIPPSILEILYFLFPISTYQLIVQGLNCISMIYCRNKISQVMQRIASVKPISMDQTPSPEDKKLLTDAEFGLVRHPVYMYFMLMAILTPRMTFTRLSCLVGWIVYLLPGVYLEEIRIEKDFGKERYDEYRKQVPYHFVPFVY